jgi:hypothetical protein
MIRERVLKVVLVIVGLFFPSNFYWLVTLRGEETLQMMLSIYVTLGVFLLLAAPNPAANRTLIAFTAWSSLAHAGVMAVQSRHDMGERVHLLIGTVAFGVIGAVLAFLLQAKAASGSERHAADHRRTLSADPSPSASR